MIVALWHRWTQQRAYRWLVILLALFVVDLLVGSLLIGWELRLLREAWS